MSTNNLKSDTTKVMINNMTFDVPNSYICPITRQVMVQPLTTRSGEHYERTAILSWLKILGTCCPLSPTQLQISDLTPNMYLQHQIKIWRQHNGLPKATTQQTSPSSDIANRNMSANNLNSATTKVMINNMTFDVPNSYICPITRQVMVQPLTTRSGEHYERTAILSWLKVLGTSPLIPTQLQISDLTPNMYLQHQIKKWKMKNGISIDGNNKDFKSFENDIISCFVSLSSKEEVGILGRIYSPNIVPSVDNKGIRKYGARWSILRRQKIYYSPLA
jgi:hypothetical protein